MAEGGGDFGYEDPELDNRLDHDDSDDGQEANRTQPFQSGAASTPYQPGDPYHEGEQMEMRTTLHEQSDLPDTSYAETSFGGEENPLIERTHSISDLQKESSLRQKLKKAVDMIKDKFPKANFEKFTIRRGTGKNEGKLLLWGLKRVSTRF